MTLDNAINGHNFSWAATKNSGKPKTPSNNKILNQQKS
jgi:hypothetical protein